MQTANLVYLTVAEKKHVAGFASSTESARFRSNGVAIAAGLIRN